MENDGFTNFAARKFAVEHHAHKPDEIGRCMLCNMWRCFNGRWHEAGTTCKTSECKEEILLAAASTPKIVSEDEQRENLRKSLEYEMMPETTEVKPTLTAKPKETAQEPISLCSIHRERDPNCHMCNWPPTSAPSQPAGAREWRNSPEIFALRWKWANPNSGMSNEDREVALLEAYAAQQTAAKDAELKEAIHWRDEAANQSSNWEEMSDQWQSRCEAAEKDLAAKDMALAEQTKLADDFQEMASNYQRDLEAAERELASLRETANKLLKAHSEALQVWMDRARKAEAENAALKAGKESKL